MMESQDFPSSHVTNAAMSAAATKAKSGIHFDRTYLHTIPGVLKAAQIVFDLLGFICVEVSRCSTCSPSSWFAFVAMTGFWITLILLVFYLFHVIEKMSFIPWIRLELAYCGIWTVLSFIAALVVSVKGTQDDAWAAAGFFGFLTMFLYGADTYYKYKAWKRGDPAQGEKSIPATTPQPTSPTSPSYPAY
ncbi:CKLF-like MARVEL transmembrane domain-containing protein 8 [Tachypleus tridentatus]|uniref:CKLF-like MARVEL transmembrane domain-containing protein 8 n=1 Tax=Tachypleus tridentatus TaxID=6853 RepID=UPI003FD43942